MPLFNLVQVSLTNGNRDKYATLFIKQGRKVLELRSRCLTSFMGHYRQEFEVTLWSGSALRNGSVLMRETYEVKLSAALYGRVPTLEEMTCLSDYSSSDYSRDLQTQVESNRARVVSASRFTLTEYDAGRTGQDIPDEAIDTSDIPEITDLSGAVLTRPGEDLIATVRAARKTSS